MKSFLLTAIFYRVQYRVGLHNQCLKNRNFIISFRKKNFKRNEDLHLHVGAIPLQDPVTSQTRVSFPINE
jgi:hypothetical protein